MSTWQLFDDLADEDGKINIDTKEERYDLTREPIVTAEILKQFPITHAWINLLNFIMLIYRTNSGLSGPNCKMGSHLTKKQKEDFKKAKNEFSEKAKKILDLKLDQPTSHGGSTNTGNAARRFFESGKRQSIVDLFNGTEKEKEAFRELHRRFAINFKIDKQQERSY